MERSALIDDRVFTLVQRTRADADFYCLMGRFFGSREIAKANGIPMYDDDDRVWCIVLNSDNKSVACACSSIALQGTKAALKSAWVEPHVRGIGLYDWMFAVRLEIAQQHSIKTITATTTEKSKHTHERYGFKQIGMRGKYYLFRKELA